MAFFAVPAALLLFSEDQTRNEAPKSRPVYKADRSHGDLQKTAGASDVPKPTSKKRRILNRLQRFILASKGKSSKMKVSGLPPRSFYNEKAVAPSILQGFDNVEEINNIPISKSLSRRSTETSASTYHADHSTLFTTMNSNPSRAFSYKPTDPSILGGFSGSDEDGPQHPLESFTTTTSPTSVPESQSHNAPNNHTDSNAFSSAPRLPRALADAGSSLPDLAEVARRHVTSAVESKQSVKARSFPLQCGPSVSSRGDNDLALVLMHF